MQDAFTVIDFQDGNQQSEWVVINDGVMGGRSQSEFIVRDSATAIFQGNVSLENFGGFASARSIPGLSNLSSFDGLAIKVRGDGKKYQLRLRSDDRFDGIAYRAHFQTLNNGEWQIVQLPFRTFKPAFRGRIVPNAPILDTGNIRQIGFLIAEKQAGPFRLEIEWIKAYRNPD